MLFTALNYRLLGIGLLLIAVGFAAMRLENEVRGFVSLYISPVVIMAGYIMVAYAILKKEHKVDQTRTTSESSG